MHELDLSTREGFADAFGLVARDDEDAIHAAAFERFNDAHDHGIPSIEIMSLLMSPMRRDKCRSKHHGGDGQLGGERVGYEAFAGPEATNEGHRSACVTWARTEMAISAGDWEPMGRPTGPWSRWSFESVNPQLGEPAQS